MADVVVVSRVIVHSRLHAIVAVTTACFFLCVTARRIRQL